MEETLKTLVKQIHSKLGESVDFLVVMGQNKNNIGVTAQGGDINKIAETLFFLIHQQEKDLSMNIYQIIKLIVVNMVKNNSIYAKDLLTAVTQYISLEHGK